MGRCKPTSRRCPSGRTSSGAALHALIVRTVPGARKVGRWNSPFYDVEGKGWVMAFRAYNNFIEGTLFRGIELKPPPVGLG